MMRWEDIRFDIGRGANGGDFLRMVHVPTGISRLHPGPLRNVNQHALQHRFYAEIAEEVAERIRQRPVSPDLLNRDALVERGGPAESEGRCSLCKCPECGHVYLYLDKGSSEALYFNGDDLRQRCVIDPGAPRFRCAACGAKWPRRPWGGDEAPAAMRVSWSELAMSAWNWMARCP